MYKRSPLLPVVRYPARLYLRKPKPMPSEDDLYADPDRPPEAAQKGSKVEDPAVVVERRQPIDSLFDQQYHSVVRFVMICGANAHDAQDATQEAFIEAFRRADDGRWTAVRDPGGWLRRVALRRYQRMVRRKLPVPRPMTDGDARLTPGLDPSSYSADVMDALSALRRLPPPCRAIMAFHLDGFSGVETAAQLGITEQQARDLLKKARRLLRHDLQWRKGGQ